MLAQLLYFFDFSLWQNLRQSLGPLGWKKRERYPPIRLSKSIHLNLQCDVADPFEGDNANITGIKFSLDIIFTIFTIEHSEIMPITFLIAIQNVQRSSTTRWRSSSSNFNFCNMFDFMHVHLKPLSRFLSACVPWSRAKARSIEVCTRFGIRFWVTPNTGRRECSSSKLWNRINYYISQLRCQR